MIIPINISLPTSESGIAEARTKLPPQLARLGDKDSDELVLIELQGDLDVVGTKAGHYVGKLSLENPSKPTLVIGHHLLEGKIATINKPLAVLRRTGVSPSTKALSDGMDVDDPSTHVANGTPSWDIIALVKRKIVFSKRPMPVVSAAKAPVSEVQAPADAGIE